MSDNEFERIRGAIGRAADIMGTAIEDHGDSRWDYLIVAVPLDQPQTRIGIMTSVPPEALPHFLKFIEVAYKTSVAAGRVIDDRKPEEKPS